MPLTDADRGAEAVAWGRWRRRWREPEPRSTEATPEGPLQGRPQQRAHRACERTRRALPARPLDDLPGHAVALQALPVLGHLRRDLVPVRAAVVLGGVGARGPAG